MKLLIALAGILCCLSIAHAESWIDAAEVDMAGNPLSRNGHEIACLRFQVDNRGNPEPATVLLSPVFATGGLGGESVPSGYLVFDGDYLTILDDFNPWPGTGEGSYPSVARDDVAWGRGIWPSTAGFQPNYYCGRQPSNPDYVLVDRAYIERTAAEWGWGDPSQWSEDIWGQNLMIVDGLVNHFYAGLGVMPPDATWELSLYFTAGTLFNADGVAQAQLTVNGQTFLLTDSDPGPQTAPEPAALGLLALGVPMLLRRRQEPLEP